MPRSTPRTRSISTGSAFGAEAAVARLASGPRPGVRLAWSGHLIGRPGAESRAKPAAPSHVRPPRKRDLVKSARRVNLLRYRGNKVLRNTVGSPARGHAMARPTPRSASGHTHL